MSDERIDTGCLSWSIVNRIAIDNEVQHIERTLATADKDSRYYEDTRAFGKELERSKTTSPITVGEYTAILESGGRASFYKGGKLQYTVLPCKERAANRVLQLGGLSLIMVIRRGNPRASAIPAAQIHRYIADQPAVVVDDLAASIGSTNICGQLVKSGVEVLDRKKERPHIPMSIRHMTCMHPDARPSALKGLTNYDILRIVRRNCNGIDSYGCNTTLEDFSSSTEFLGAGAVTAPARHQAGLVAFLTCEAGEALFLVWPDLGDDEVAEWGKANLAPAPAPLAIHLMEGGCLVLPACRVYQCRAKVDTTIHVHKAWYAPSMAVSIKALHQELELGLTTREGLPCEWYVTLHKSVKRMWEQNHGFFEFAGSEELNVYCQWYEVR